MACHRLRKAALAGGKVFFINPRGYDYHFPLAGYRAVGADGMVDTLAAVAQALAERDGAPRYPTACAV